MTPDTPPEHPLPDNLVEGAEIHWEKTTRSHPAGTWVVLQINTRHRDGAKMILMRRKFGGEYGVSAYDPDKMTVITPAERRPPRALRPDFVPPSRKPEELRAILRGKNLKLKPE